MDTIHITTAHSALDTRIFDKQARSLVDAGFDVGIVAHDAPSSSREGVHFESLGTVESRGERWQSIVKAARVAKHLDPDIYHFHDLELIPAGLYLAETTDGAVVFDVHENYGHAVTSRKWIPAAVAPILARGIPLFERLAARRLDAIVAVSEWIADPFNDVADRVEVVHNFPRTESMPTVEGSVERDAEHVLCYVGGIVEVRGIQRMLELLDTLLNRGIDVELWVAGNWTPDANREAAQAFIEEHDLESHIRFPGYLSYDAMFRHLRSADVGLALLDTEHYRGGIPTKLFEYLYAGLPVVTTPVDAVSRFIPEEYREVVPQGDAEAAADAVETTLETNYDPEAMRSLVEEQYSWEHEAETLVSLYEELLE